MRQETIVRRKRFTLTVRSLLFALAFFTPCSLLLGPCSLAQAQQSQKVFRVGYLSALSAAAEANRFDIIRSALREHGYIENRDIVFENRYSEGKSERAAELAADLVRLNVDLIIVAGGDVWIRAARTATKKIPIIMTGGGLDPIAAGHVES